MADVPVEWRAPVTAADVSSLHELDDAWLAAAGYPAIGDATWRDLDAPGPRSAIGFAVVDDLRIGGVHVAPAENEPHHVQVALVCHPDHKGRGAMHSLAAAARERAATDGAERALAWVFGASSATDGALAEAGYAPERELWQMRVPLPADDATWPDGVTVRPFVPGTDDEAWLTANNRAFVDDPDQHGWTLDVLRRRVAEPWFDAAGFLLAVDADGVAGFCWTKLQSADPPAEPDVLGEIYVIGVDPDRQGKGLGRALVLAGLASLHERGAPIGMLFVDAANTDGVRLYEKLGFEVARIDRAYGAALR